MVECRRTVAICGSSLFLACVGASLSSKSELAVVQIDAALPNVRERLTELSPDLIIFDVGESRVQLLGLASGENPNPPMLGLGLTKNTVVTLTGQQYSMFSTEDLVQLIEEQVAKGS